MNFLSLRNQLNNWTLNSDDKLYRAIKQLSETVLDAQKLILNNIQTTRYEVTRGQVESGCSYNHYLRISQTKFTENKIGQKKSEQVKEANAAKLQARNKMEVFKQAIDLGAKNLQIIDEKAADNDLISISDTSLSQSIYKDCRLPAFYGTKQFASNSFLNLFTQTQLNATVPCQKFETNELVITGQLQQELLPPPPILQANLLQNSNLPPSGLLPPPPPLNLLPPTLPLLPPLSSLGLPPVGSLPELPPLIATLSQPTSNNRQQSSLPEPPPLLPLLADQTQSKSLGNANIAEHDNNLDNNLPLAPPSQKPNQTLSIQEELALRLKHGKNYKKQIEIKDQLTVQKIQPQPDNIKKQQINSTNNNNKLAQISQQRQSVDSNINIRASLRDSYGGINLNPLASNPINQTKQVPKQQQEEEEIDTFFGPAKSKNRQTKRVLNLENDIMKRQTFNEDILFKKKPLPEKKETQKPKNMLFAEGSDDQSLNIGFKKKQQKIKPVVIPPTPAQKDKGRKEVGKKKGLLDSDSDQDTSDLFKKKADIKPKQTIVPPAPTTTKVKKDKPSLPVAPIAEKKALNPLFQPSQPKASIQEKGNDSSLIVSQNNRQVRKSQSQFSQNDERIDALSSRDKASNYAMKAAAAGGMGMFGMGMPLLPKGMSITKPSEAKKNQQQALQRLKREQQEERKAREEQQKRIQIQRRQEYQRMQQQKKKNQQQNIKKALQQEQRKKLNINTQIPALPTLPKIANPSPQKKQNTLFNDDEEEEDFFKAKTKKLTQHSQIGVPIKTKVQNIRQTQYLPSNAVNQQKMEITKQAKNQLSATKVETTSLQNEKVAVERTESIKTQLTTRRKKAKPTVNTQQFFGTAADVQQQAPKVQKRQDSTSNAQKISKIGRQQQKEVLKRQQLEQKRRQEQQQLKLQQEKKTLEKIKRQEQLRLKQKQIIQKEQQQKEKQLEQQRIRKQKQMLQKIRLQEQQKKRQEQKQKKYEQTKRKQEQQRRIKQQQRRIKQIQQTRARQQQLRRQQALRKQQAQRQQIKRLEKIRRQEAQAKQIEEQKKRNEELKKQPLAPFLPKIPTRSQPLGLGPLGTSTLPKLPPKTNQNKTSITKKGAIFNDDDQPQLNFSKQTKPATNNVLVKPTGLTNNAEESKKRLFDEDDDLEDNFLLGKKTPMEQNKSNQSKKTVSKLFNDDDQQIEIKTQKKSPPVSTPIQPIKQGPKSNPVGQAAKKKSLFDDDDDDDLSSNFLKKPTQKKVEPVLPTKNHMQQQQTPVLQKAPLGQPLAAQKQMQSKKKGLFDDDDDDDSFLNVKKGPQNPVQNQSISPVAKQTINTNTNKRNLFADSDSDQDSYTAKQQQKKKEAAKKVRQFN